MQFQFKKFTINQSDKVFKFGTDAALLAVWVDLSSSVNVLEIGIGTGVISLMMKQRNPNANYTGIDISEEAVNLANQNLANYPTPDNIAFIQSSVQEFEPKTPFDCIVTNPPFFDNATKSPSPLKNMTRHTDSLLLTDLIQHSKRLLSPTGTLSLIYPVRYLDDLTDICAQNALFINEITFTRSTSKKPIKRVLVKISKQKQETKQTELIINGDFKGYSKTVFGLLQPFLLKL